MDFSKPDSHSVLHIILYPGLKIVPHESLAQKSHEI